MTYRGLKLRRSRDPNVSILNQVKITDSSFCNELKDFKWVVADVQIATKRRSE